MENNDISILVSIIVPIYNMERYLDKCIHSLVEQTYKNIEILLIDDGSTDKTPAICDEWLNKDSRIKVIHKKNGGVSSARNIGLKKCTGTYVAFVDSDDYVKKKYIEILLTSAVKNNCEMSIVNMIEKLPDGAEDIYTFSTPTKLLNRHDFLENLYKKRTYRCAIWNKLFLKKIIDDNHIFFREDVYHGEDLFFVVKFAEKCNNFYYEYNENLYYYCYREGSLSKGHFNKKNASMLKICDEVIKIYKKNNVDSCSIKNKYIVFYYFSLYFFNEEKNYSKQEYKKIYKKYFNDVFKSNEITYIEKIILIGIVLFPKTMKIVKKIKVYMELKNENIKRNERKK